MIVACNCVTSSGSISHVVDHIDHICQLAGNADHATIGSDLPGGFRHEQSPRDLDSITNLQATPNHLRRRGYSEIDVNQIMHGNWLRLRRKDMIWLMIGLANSSFPFNRRGRFAGDIKDNPVHFRHQIDNPVRHQLEKIVWQSGPICGHEIARGHGPQCHQV
jgi:hypothetical protein